MRACGRVPRYPVFCAVVFQAVAKRTRRAEALEGAMVVVRRTPKAGGPAAVEKCCWPVLPRECSSLLFHIRSAADISRRALAKSNESTFDKLQLSKLARER